jgi:hypothetical protein
MNQTDMNDIKLLITHKVAQRIPFAVHATFEVKDSIAQDFADAIVTMYEDVEGLETPTVIRYPATWWDAFKERWMGWLFFVNVVYAEHVITPVEVIRHSTHIKTLLHEKVR